MTRVVFLGLFAGVCIGLNGASAQVGPCSGEIAQIESALRQPGSDVGPTLRQTVGAQLDVRA